MVSSEDVDDLLLARACVIAAKILVKKKRRWMRSLYRNRELYSGCVLLNDLKLNCSKSSTQKLKTN